MGLSEHPHGSMKRNDDASYFLLKGLNKVEIETALYYSAFNLRRVIKILGVPRILELLEASSDSFIHSLIKRLLLSKQSLFFFRTVSPMYAFCKYHVKNYWNTKRNWLFIYQFLKSNIFLF